jgi:hypothetical protein
VARPEPSATSAVEGPPKSIAHATRADKLPSRELDAGLWRYKRTDARTDIGRVSARAPVQKDAVDTGAAWSSINAEINASMLLASACGLVSRDTVSENDEGS